MEELIDKLLSTPYVAGGRDLNGVDCWGLCILCLEEFHGKEVENFDGCIYEEDRDNKEELYKWIDTWKYEQFYEVESAQEGDVVLVKYLGYPIHIGYMIDNQRMLHIRLGHGAAVENVNSPKWKNKIIGFYRLK